jgi:hypothetical protein
MWPWRRLNDGAPVGIGVRVFNLIVRQPRIFLEQQRPNLIGPEQVDDLFMRQNRVGERRAVAQDED